jgi:hypothetical protein
MTQQNLLYALTQVGHNLGAVAVTGGAVLAQWPQLQDARGLRRLAWLVLAGWALQAATGASFGAISLTYAGALPDIHGVALAALLLKMACAVTGFVLTAAYLRSGARWLPAHQEALWRWLAALAVTALSAAAFLRWFS